MTLPHQIAATTFELGFFSIVLQAVGRGEGKKSMSAMNEIMRPTEETSKVENQIPFSIVSAVAFPSLSLDNHLRSAASQAMRLILPN